MTTWQETQQEQQRVDAMLRLAAESLAQEGGGTIDQRIALAHASAAARIATALESIDHYGIEALMREQVRISIGDPVTVYTR